MYNICTIYWLNSSRNQCVTLLKMYILVSIAFFLFFVDFINSSCCTLTVYFSLNIWGRCSPIPYAPEAFEFFFTIDNCRSLSSA